MDFKELKKAINSKFVEMTKNGDELFRVDVSGDFMWSTYLSSFPEGTNKIFKKRAEHDCSSCRHFIKSCGNVVSITENNQLVSLWDVSIPEPYQTVVDKMSALMKSRFIVDVFRHREKSLGVDFNRQMLEDESIIRWEHLYFELPQKYVNKDSGEELGEARSRKEVLKRGLSEITLDSAEIVLELIDQNSLYRGHEHKSIVELFIEYKNIFDSISNLEEKDIFCWGASTILKNASKLRNTVIGTLLVDLSDGVELDKAVKSFEQKVAPTNYKRPTALITKSMIKKAQEEVEKLGITDSLPRRYAVAEDLTINNVLFANRETKKSMNVFDELSENVEQKVNLEKVEEIPIADFVSNVLPKVSNVELFFENKHCNNLMSLIAPQNSDSKRIFKWNNNFSWAYNGEVTDSIKERVKSAGGNVEGDLRYSLSWFNYDDLDAWAKEPNGNSIGFSNKFSHTSGGNLDVDMNAGGSRSRTPVENITWPNKSRMQEGVYTVWVNQYTNRETCDVGFDAELEYDGTIYTFHYAKSMRIGENVSVATFKFSQAEGLKIINSLPSTQSSKEIWNIPTQTFRKVSMILNSPNHWDGNTTGNKHLFFILDDCKNEKPARGFFNEFLSSDLNVHRKVFEVLGSKMKTPKSENQLSGLGFSSTQRNQVLCKVSGSFNRMLKIVF